MIETQGGHHFDGDYDALAADILKGIPAPRGAASPREAGWSRYIRESGETFCLFRSLYAIILPGAAGVAVKSKWIAFGDV